MTQKKETTPVESKAVTEATPVKPETKTDAGTQQNEQLEQTSKTEKSGRAAGDLSPELTELVMELRDTVKRIDPRKHTEKTLRRVLFNISDILKDIEALYTKS
jgi:hypothetical protein